MQIIAYTSMILNHMFNMEWIGVALPIFAYYIIIGMKKTKNIEWYILRVIIIGLISQLFWPIPNKEVYKINELLVIGVTMLAMQESKLANILKVLIFFAWMNTLMAVQPLYLMLFAKEAIQRKNMKVYTFGIIIFVAFCIPMYPQQMRWLLTPILFKIKYLTREPRLNKILKYSIYPVHLLIMRII